MPLAAVSVVKAGGILVHKDDSWLRGGKFPLVTGATLPSEPLSPEQRAQAQALAQAIREAITAEIEDLARPLVNTDDAHLFGDNELTMDCQGVACRFRAGEYWTPLEQLVHFIGLSVQAYLSGSR